jgi:hypothetical protein
MRGQVVKMGATFGGLEAIPPNEATGRPIGHRTIENAGSRCRPGSAFPGGDFIDNRDAHDRRE